MSPLEVSECPSDIAERAREHPDWARGYTTQQFLDTAARYFDVSLESYLGIRPLYLMKKKIDSSPQSQNRPSGSLQNQVS